MRSIFTAVLAALALASPAAAKKPDLIIKSGNAAISGKQITGSFIVRNRGKAKATPSNANVSMGADGFPDQEIQGYEVKGIKKAKGRTFKIAADIPENFKPLTYRVTACADPYGGINESKEDNNCRVVGNVTISAPTKDAKPATPAGPVEYEKDQPFQLESGKSDYWVNVPTGYKDSTATPLLVWMHGCGGDSGGDIYTIAPTDGRVYIAVSVGGRDGGCWDVNKDSELVLAAVKNVSSHFNINKRRVVIGGFSSGGDLAYRTAFTNSTLFAGVLAACTLPFRDTGLTQEQAISGASNKFHVVHLAATEDDTYTIDSVRKETDALKGAGFDVQRVEKPGAHYDESTDGNIQKVLLPHMTDNWTSP